MASKKGGGEFGKFLATTKARKRPSSLDGMPVIKELVDHYVDRLIDGSTEVSCEQLHEFLVAHHKFPLSVSSLRNYVRRLRNAKTQG